MDPRRPNLWRCIWSRVFTIYYIPCYMPYSRQRYRAWALWFGNEIPNCYGFPRPVQKYASLNTVKDTIKSNVKPGSKRKRLYNLARSWGERYINDYNPLLLLLWEFGNIDAQVIATIERALNNYCSGYLTKGEKNHTQELWQDCNKNKTLFGKLKSLAMTIIILIDQMFWLISVCMILLAITNLNLNHVLITAL